jgi:hypothetical protein
MRALKKENKKVRKSLQEQEWRIRFVLSSHYIPRKTKLVESVQITSKKIPFVFTASYWYS